MIILKGVSLTVQIDSEIDQQMCCNTGEYAEIELVKLRLTCLSSQKLRHLLFAS